MNRRTYEQIAAASYRVTAYANDATGRELESAQCLDMEAVGRAVAAMFKAWNAAGYEVHVLVVKWDGA